MVVRPEVERPPAEVAVEKTETARPRGGSNEAGKHMPNVSGTGAGAMKVGSKRSVAGNGLFESTIADWVRRRGIVGSPVRLAMLSPPPETELERVAS